MSVQILGAKESSNQDWIQLEEIFFEASAIKNFASHQAKESFRNKYLYFYKEKYHSHFYVLYEKGIAKGYVCGAPHTLQDNYFLASHPYLESVLEELQTYPSHLHINLAQDTRGKGYGKILVDHFIESLKAQLFPEHTSGIHIVTATQSRNRHFYTRCGFSYAKEIIYQGNGLVFMGKPL